MRRECFEFSVPIRPPSSNNLYRNRSGRRGWSDGWGRAMTASYIVWRTQMGLILNQRVADATHRGVPLPFGGPVALTYNVARGDATRRMDLGNREKAMTDLLVHCGVLDDDSIVQRLTMCWVPEQDGLYGTVELLGGRPM